MTKRVDREPRTQQYSASTVKVSDTYTFHLHDMGLAIHSIHKHSSLLKNLCLNRLTILRSCPGLQCIECSNKLRLFCCCTAGSILELCPQGVCCGLMPNAVIAVSAQAAGSTSLWLEWPEGKFRAIRSGTAGFQSSKHKATCAGAVYCLTSPKAQNSPIASGCYWLH